MRDVEGQTLVNLRGDKVGTIDETACVANKEDSRWACVKYGPLHLRCTYVPLHDAVLEDGHVRVPYETEIIQRAPEVDLDENGRIPEHDARKLHRHFGLEPLDDPSAALEDDKLDLPRKPRDAVPPAMEEGEDSPLTKRRRERARELGLPQHD